MISKVRNEDRRKEIGKMLLDIAKYLATVGLIGGILTNSITLFGGISIGAIAILLVSIAFYVIPAKQEEK